jgi:hypothetical protein
MNYALGAFLALVVMGAPPATDGPVASPPHAYYLFVAGAAPNCEDCYVPLLVAQESLEEIAASGRERAVVVVTTYERDSIWKVERGVSLAGASVSAAERTLRLRDRRYRYQEIGPAEVLRLLEKPEGRIPISRILAIPARESLSDLIAAFRGGKP